MSQAMHILRKDLRYLWGEVCLLTALSALFAFQDSWWIEVLIGLTAAYLVERLIHAEPIPGDTQFWITRPYSWKSLLASKVLFIVIFVNGPIFAARLAIVILNNFPLRGALPALLWSQLLMVAAVCLPVAALAAVTADIMPFIFSSLILVFIGFAVENRSLRFITEVADWFHIDWFRRRPPAPDVWPGGMVWVQNSVLMATLIVTAAAVLFLQYKRRWTWVSRISAVLVLVIGLTAGFMMPSTFAMEFQRRLSRDLLNTSQIAVTVADKPYKFAARKDELVQLSLSFNLAGIPDGLDTKPDALLLTLNDGGGGSWETIVMPDRRPNAGGTILDTNIFVDQPFFEAHRGRGVTLRGSLYLTAFGNERARSLLVTHTPANVGDGVQCLLNEIDQLVCQSAFRWPNLLVYAKVRDETESMWPMVSYSPFPAGVDLNYVEAHWSSGPPPHAPMATIIMKEPLSHFRKDFVVENVLLENYSHP